MSALTTTAGIPKYDVWRPSPSFTAIENLSELALQGKELNVSNRRQWSGNFHGIEIVGLSGIGKSTLTKYLFNDGEELPWIERATFDVLVYRKLQWGRTVVGSDSSRVAPHMRAKQKNAVLTFTNHLITSHGAQ